MCFATMAFCTVSVVIPAATALEKLPPEQTGVAGGVTSTKPLGSGSVKPAVMSLSVLLFMVNVKLLFVFIKIVGTPSSGAPVPLNDFVKPGTWT